MSARQIGFHPMVVGRELRSMAAHENNREWIPVV
jgi:hypothetical protein